MIFECTDDLIQGIQLAPAGAAAVSTLNKRPPLIYLVYEYLIY